MKIELQMQVMALRLLRFIVIASFSNRTGQADLLSECDDLIRGVLRTKSSDRKAMEKALNELASNNPNKAKKILLDHLGLMIVSPAKDCSIDAQGNYKEIEIILPANSTP